MYITATSIPAAPETQNTVQKNAVAKTPAFIAHIPSPEYTLESSSHWKCWMSGESAKAAERRRFVLELLDTTAKLAPALVTVLVVAGRCSTASPLARQTAIMLVVMVTGAPMACNATASCCGTFAASAPASEAAEISSPSNTVEGHAIRSWLSASSSSAFTDEGNATDSSEILRRASLLAGEGVRNNNTSLSKSALSGSASPRAASRSSRPMSAWSLSAAGSMLPTPAPSSLASTSPPLARLPSGEPWAIQRCATNGSTTTARSGYRRAHRAKGA
mmetsp:Transcript_95397/g.269744  ORF Transcript_95397/g.269744 Transcript_95397/m.269744 type:complete len:275 (-) Transcript_95397:3-827(-)